MSTTSAPAAPCCPEGSWPQLLLRTKDELNKDDIPEPSGKVITIETTSDVDERKQLPMYVVEPPTTSTPIKGAIMVLPDIYSVRVFNTAVRSGDRIGSICDVLANDHGYVVAMPNVFRDKPYDVAIATPEDGVFEKFNAFGPEGAIDWFKSHNYETLKPDVIACAKYLQDKLEGIPASTSSSSSSSSLGVIGFCFGSWLLSKTSAMGDVTFKCAIGAHPTTLLEEAVFGGMKQVELLSKLKQPTRFLWASNDSDVFIGTDGLGKKAVEENDGDVIEFNDMLHGWVSRGDMADPKIKDGVEKAMKCIVEFLNTKM